jgi:hypothetical protein
VFCESISLSKSISHKEIIRQKYELVRTLYKAQMGKKGS